MASAREVLGLGVVGASTLAVMVAWGGLLSARERATDAMSADLPRSSESVEHVGSAACLPCHPGEHASFSKTFHRTMTQAASPATVLAPFERRGNTVSFEGRRVVMTTGSHRHQAYWTEGDRAGDLQIVPRVWLVKEQRLVPRDEAFVTPPGVPLGRARWGSSCIACHAVAGEPRHDESKDAFDLRVAELGIACEACHGPGAVHVARHRDPFERYAQHSSGRADPTIVHPKRLPPERSAAVCGQCHSYAFPRREDEWWTTGYARAFRAGDALEPSRVLLAAGGGGAMLSATDDSLFWPDGTIRVGGREHNGLVLSPCYAQGTGDRKMTCLSCHAMHEGDPAGQIAPSKRGDRGCVGCHAATKEHSHHVAGSPGAACVACHMPKTSYALLSAVRSHRIESPKAVDTGKPNACNLCHLDRSLAWTFARLAEWFGHGAPAAPSTPSAVAEDPEGARYALAGNAAVRVLVADALGSADAEAAHVPAAFRSQLLGVLADDPYAAVRFVAGRSRGGVAAAPPPLNDGLVRRLLAARDGRAVTIAE